jgi:hypothetical protein
MSKLFHPLAVEIARLALGVTLIFASWHKITDPGDFVLIIYNYRLFPRELIHALAIFVPWLELLAGLALVMPTLAPRKAGDFGERLFLTPYIWAALRACSRGLARCRGGAALLAAVFFASFIIALSYNLSRDCPTICGCFGTHADGTELTIDEKFGKMRTEVALDCVLVVLAVYCVAGFSKIVGKDPSSASA